MGRLPAVLHALPLPADARGLRGVPFQPWLRGSIDGISPLDFRALFARARCLRRGMLRHVFLHASLERRHADRGSEVRDELDAAGFDKRLVESNVAQMTRLVEQPPLPGRPTARGGTTATTCSYSDARRSRRRSSCGVRSRHATRTLVWDLGCNDGRYSRIASETRGPHAWRSTPTAVVVDVALPRRSARADSRRFSRSSSTSPIPSPAIGWRNRERTTLVERGLPDLALCLALVHHLSIWSNVPLREIVDWLRSLELRGRGRVPGSRGPHGAATARGEAGRRPSRLRLGTTFESLLGERFEVVESARAPVRNADLCILLARDEPRCLPIGCAPYISSRFGRTQSASRCSRSSRAIRSFSSFAGHSVR